MEPLFKLCVDDINSLLPHMKQRLMSGAGNAQVTMERIMVFLRNANQLKRDDIVGKLVNFDVISSICYVMQESDENFVKVVLECFELVCMHKKFYENHAAMDAVTAMLRLSYCVNISLKDSTLFEKLVQCVCSILVRSSELAVDLDDVCVLQQIVLFVKKLDVRDTRKDKLKFAAVTMLNVVLQRAVFDENADEEMIIDVCRDALKSMTEIVKYGDDDNMILHAAVILCSTCAGGSRFCNVDFAREHRADDDLTFPRKKSELSNCVYNTMMNTIIPYFKSADLSCVDSIAFHRNIVSCLNNLYQLRNCNHDNLSNHLAANGYLKYFLRLTVELPDNLRRSICILLSRILSILGKTAFSKDTIKFANILRQGLVELPNYAERWNNSIAHFEKDGTALLILLYYHFHGTGENDITSLESLVARVMLLPRSKKSVSVLILKPLWLLFAVTSISHPCPNSVHHYESAVTRLTDILHSSEIGEFYSHHIDLLHHCLKCPGFSPIVNQVLDLWLIESDGDIKPLLPFNCDSVVHRLLVVVQTGYPQRVISLAMKGLSHLIQIGDRYVKQIADIVWHMLPNILSSYKSNNVVHIETVLELANIVRPHTMPIHLIIRSADSIVNIILKKTTDSEFMTAVVKQAYVLLVAAMSRKSFKVLQAYIQKTAMLKKLYAYGFSKERSELSTISIKLLAFIIYCQKKSSIKCKRSLIIDMKSLAELLAHARKSPCCAMNGIQFIFELLTQNVDGLAVVLQKIATNSADVEMIINLYEILHIHAQNDPVQRDVVCQCLTALLHFCNAQVTNLVPHLCTVMSNYDLILSAVQVRYTSCYFIEFVAVWLCYRKARCNDVPWNSRSLYKSPFDEVLDYLRQYCAIVKNKGFKDAYLNLQQALSQFE